MHDRVWFEKHQIDISPPIKFIGSYPKELLDKSLGAGIVSAFRIWLIYSKVKVHSMKVVNSLKTLKSRDRNNRVIRRKGRVYVINKKNPRMKARQG